MSSPTSEFFLCVLLVSTYLLTPCAEEEGEEATNLVSCVHVVPKILGSVEGYYVCCTVCDMFIFLSCI